MRTVVGGTRRAAPPQVQPRPDLRHYFATNQWEASWAGLHVQPRPRCSPASICRLQPGASRSVSLHLISLLSASSYRTSTVRVFTSNSGTGCWPNTFLSHWLTCSDTDSIRRCTVDTTCRNIYRTSWYVDMILNDCHFFSKQLRIHGVAIGHVQNIIVPRYLIHIYHIRTWCIRRRIPDTRALNV